MARSLKKGYPRVAWVAQLVKWPGLDFGSGHDLMVGEFEPCADSVESAWDSLPLSPRLPCSCSLYFFLKDKQTNKQANKQINRYFQKKEGISQGGLGQWLVTNKSFSANLQSKIKGSVILWLAAWDSGQQEFSGKGWGVTWCHSCCPWLQPLQDY